MAIRASFGLAAAAFFVLSACGGGGNSSNSIPVDKHADGKLADSALTASQSYAYPDTRSGGRAYLRPPPAA